MDIKVNEPQFRELCIQRGDYGSIVKGDRQERVKTRKFTNWTRSKTISLEREMITFSNNIIKYRD
jgi:hypothetical protein